MPKVLIFFSFPFYSVNPFHVDNNINNNNNNNNNSSKMMPTWETKKGKTSEFLDAEGYNMYERAGNWRLGMG